MQIDTIDPAKAAMIVVDMQNDFVADGAPMETPAARAMVPKLAEALKICRDAGIRVIYTAHVHRRDGCDILAYNSGSMLANPRLVQQCPPALTTTVGRNDHGRLSSRSDPVRPLYPCPCGLHPCAADKRPISDAISAGWTGHGASVVFSPDGSDGR